MTESIEKLLTILKKKILGKNKNEKQKTKQKGESLNPHKVKRAPERWLADGKYNDKPLDADYFKKILENSFTSTYNMSYL